MSNDIGSKSEQEINAKRFERAENVVRGRFTYISLGPDVRRGFTVKMHVERAIKGNLGGEIELYTGFGNGDCGLVGMVMGRMLHDRPVDIEIRTSPSREDGRMGGIDSCGYIAEPQPSSSSRGARER
ncbi:MAG: hypothetical protein C3F11_17435 [Methylocystaceae bacterium]|nr:MAG: hypothetical protein C3F11_17435 [Methylocystaceae bacterium]